MALTKDPGVVGDDAVLRVADGFVTLKGDFAGDGFDDAEDSCAEFGVSRGSAEVVGADLVEEAAAATGGAGLFDEDFAGAEGDGLDGAIVEVDEVGRDEHEEEDGGDEDVVVEAATLVGPEDVVADEFHGFNS